MQGAADNSTSWLNFAQTPVDQGGLGLAPHQAAGLVGNLVNESGQGLTPWGVSGDNGTAQGTAQWRGDRLAALKAAYPDSYQTTASQQAFMRREMLGSENNAYKALLAAKSPEEAADAVNHLYERSADTTNHRASSARQFYSQLTGQPTDGPTAIEQAMGLSKGPSPMAYANDDSTNPNGGVLSTNATLGPGVLAGPANGAAGGGLESGLMGAAAALAGIASPQQAATLNSMRTAGGTFSTSQLPDGTLVRINNKTGTIEKIGKFGPKPNFDYKFGPDGTMIRTDSTGATPPQALGNYGQDKFDDKSAELDAKAARDRMDSVNEAATSADAGLARIQRAKDILTNPSVYQGFGGDQVAQAKAAASALGINVSGLSDSQILDRIGTEMQLDNGKLLKGSISNYEDALMKKAAGVSLNNTPEANKDALGAREWLYNQQKAIAQHAREYAQAHGGRLKDDWETEVSNFRDQYAKDHPFAPTSTPSVKPGQVNKTSTGVNWSF